MTRPHFRLMRALRDGPAMNRTGRPVPLVAVISPGDPRRYVPLLEPMRMGRDYASDDWRFTLLFSTDSGRAVVCDINSFRGDACMRSGIAELLRLAKRGLPVGVVPGGGTARRLPRGLPLARCRQIRKNRQLPVFQDLRRAERCRNRLLG